MACGTPVVAFATGGPTVSVEHWRTGYLAEPFSADSLADGIVWCIEDDHRKAEIGSRARRRAEREFEIDVDAERHESMYENILGMGRSEEQTLNSSHQCATRMPSSA